MSIRLPWGLMGAGWVAGGALGLALSLGGGEYLGAIELGFAGPLFAGILAWRRSLAVRFDQRTAATIGAVVVAGALFAFWVFAVLLAISAIPPGFNEDF
jgi:hypothetical protein